VSRSVATLGGVGSEVLGSVAIEFLSSFFKADWLPGCQTASQQSVSLVTMGVKAGLRHSAGRRAVTSGKWRQDVAEMPASLVTATVFDGRAQILEHRFGGVAARNHAGTICPAIRQVHIYTVPATICNCQQGAPAVG
jgi:hypothetical protein